MSTRRTSWGFAPEPPHVIHPPDRFGALWGVLVTALVAVTVGLVLVGAILAGALVGWAGVIVAGFALLVHGAER
jgi:hypothetical protein